MNCIICDSAKVNQVEVRRDEVLKDTNISYVAHVLKCENCGNEMSNPSLMKMNLIASAEAYRVAKGLLRGEQILSYRKSLNMTQEQFADYLGVGEASVKRWETGHIQDKANDNLIRAKCDVEYIASTEDFIHSETGHDPQYTGNRNFSIEILAHVILQIVREAPSALFYFKALFYIDFMHFKAHKKSITGLSYEALPFGLIPSNYRMIESKLIDMGYFRKIGKHDIEGLIEPNLNMFTRDELATISKIKDVIAHHAKAYLLNKSHDEVAYLETESWQRIPYDLALKSELIP